MENQHPATVEFDKNPIEDQLTQIKNFIDQELVNGTLELDEDPEFNHHKIAGPKYKPSSRLTLSTEAALDEDQQTQTSRLILINTGNRSASVSFNPDGTVDLYDQQSNHYDESELEEYELTPEEVAARPDFESLLSFTAGCIESIQNPDAVRLTVPETSMQVIEAETVSTNRDIGYGEQQQLGMDSLLVDAQYNTYGVFDGIGSKAGSEAAARLSGAIIQERMAAIPNSANPLEVQQALVAACNDANRSIYKHSIPEGANLGTTATVVKLCEYDGKQFAAWVSVGDSRLYARLGDEIKQISEDEGEGNVIYNALGGPLESPVRQSGVFEIPEGTDLLLVTDGITGDRAHELLEDSEILECLKNGNTAQAATENLLRAARKMDDRAVVVVRSKENSATE